MVVSADNRICLAVGKVRRISSLSHNVRLREVVGCAPPQAGALQAVFAGRAVVASLRLLPLCLVSWHSDAESFSCCVCHTGREPDGLCTEQLHKGMY